MKELFEITKRASQLAERQWLAKLDLKFIQDESLHRDIPALVQRVKSALENFIREESVKVKLGEIELGELQTIAEDIDWIEDLDELDDKLTEIYDWADAYGIWVETL